LSSIRRRILVPLLPLLALALLVAALAIYAAVRRDLRVGLDRTLVVLARGVGTALNPKLAGDIEFERDKVAALGFSGSSPDAFYVVRDEENGVVASSISPAPGPFPADPEEPRYGEIRIDGREVRVCTLEIFRESDVDEEDELEWQEAHPDEPVPERESRRLRVTVGHTTAEVDATLLALRTRLALGFGGLFLALALLPTWIVSRALRALTLISDEAEAVGPQAPQQRLSEEGVVREVRPLVAALNRALDRLGEAYLRQKRFTADAAHELRTPLSALRARCEVALRKPRTPEELREELEAILRTTLRLTGLVEHLLALARLEGEASFLEDSADLARAVREAARLHQAAARAKGVDLAVSAPEALPFPGSEPLLTELLSNLVENAVRYTESGGRVELTGGASPCPWVAVEDTGIGVPPEHREHIFDRFYRADPARSRAEGGAGLGLAIARQIARLHGGDLTLEIPERGGSRFVLRFAGPLAADP